MPPLHRLSGEHEGAHPSFENINTFYDDEPIQAGSFAEVNRQLGLLNRKLDDWFAKAETWHLNLELKSGGSDQLLTLDKRPLHPDTAAPVLFGVVPASHEESKAGERLLVPKSGWQMMDGPSSAKDKTSDSRNVQEHMNRIETHIRSSRRETQRRKNSSTSSESSWEYAGNFHQSASIVVRSVWFDALFTLAVVFNSLFIGVQVQYNSGSEAAEPIVIFDIIEFLFWLLFVVELSLRILVDGAEFWRSGKSWAWNWFDTILVLTSTIELVVNLTSTTSSADNLSMLRLVRVLRIMRMMRMVRLMRFFQQLRILVISIISIFKSLAWALLLLLMVMYLFGIMFTSAAADALQQGREIQYLEMYYGSLPRSLYSLFMSISGGADWGDVVDPLSEMHPAYVPLFIVYISFVLFALLNVMTGVFCQSAIESAEKDQDMVIQQLMSHKREVTHKLENIFAEKLLGTGSESAPAAVSEAELTIQEFERHLKDEKLQAWLSSIGIDISDGWALFKLLDRDMRGTIQAGDFVEGCLRLRGTAKKIDVAELRAEAERTSKMLTELMSAILQLEKALDGAHQPRAGRASNGTRVLPMDEE